MPLFVAGTLINVDTTILKVADSTELLLACDVSSVQMAPLKQRVQVPVALSFFLTYKAMYGSSVTKTMHSIMVITSVPSFCLAFV